MAVLPVVVSLLGEYIWTLDPAVLPPVLAVLPLKQLVLCIESEQRYYWWYYRCQYR